MRQQPTGPGLEGGIADGGEGPHADEGSIGSQVRQAFVGGSRRRVLLFLLLIVVYLPTASLAPPMVNDNISMSAAAWNLGTNGSLEFTSQGIEGIPWGVVLEDGSLYSNRFPGTFVAAALVYRVLPVEVFRPPGNEGIPLWPGAIAAALFTALAVVVLVEVLRQVVTPRTALGAGLVVAFATPVWSIAANELWTHGPAILALGLGVLAVSRERFAWAGAAFGYAILVRPTFALVPLVIGLWAGATRRSFVPVAWIGVTSAVGLGALSLYTQTIFGTWLPVAGYMPGRVSAAVGTDPALIGGYTMLEQVFGTFFDTYRGVFVFSPFLVLLVPALRAGWRQGDWWVRAAAAAGLIVWITQLRANMFPGGLGFWGYRFPIEPLFLMAPLMALTYQLRIRPVRLWRFATLTAVVGAFAIILPGAAWYSTKSEPARPQYAGTEGRRAEIQSHYRRDGSTMPRGGPGTGPVEPVTDGEP